MLKVISNNYYKNLFASTWNYLEFKILANLRKKIAVYNSNPIRLPSFARHLVMHVLSYVSRVLIQMRMLLVLFRAVGRIVNGNRYTILKKTPFWSIDITHAYKTNLLSTPTASSFWTYTRSTSSTFALLVNLRPHGERSSNLSKCNHVFWLTIPSLCSRAVINESDRKLRRWTHPKLALIKSLFDEHESICEACKHKR